MPLGNPVAGGLKSNCTGLQVSQKRTHSECGSAYGDDEAPTVKAIKTNNAKDEAAELIYEFLSNIGYTQNSIEILHTFSDNDEVTELSIESPNDTPGFSDISSVSESSSMDSNNWDGFLDIDEMPPVRAETPDDSDMEEFEEVRAQMYLDRIDRYLSVPDEHDDDALQYPVDPYQHQLSEFKFEIPHLSLFRSTALVNNHIAAASLSNDSVPVGGGDDSPWTYNAAQEIFGRPYEAEEQSADDANDTVAGDASTSESDGSSLNEASDAETSGAESSGAESGHTSSDASESSSESESSDDESENHEEANDDHVQTDGPAAMPATFIPSLSQTSQPKPLMRMINLGSSSVASRLPGFLAAIGAANRQLDEERAAGTIQGRQIELKDEDVDHSDAHIEMNLGLGVLEVKKEQLSESESEVSEEEALAKLKSVAGGNTDEGKKIKIEELAEEDNTDVEHVDKKIKLEEL